MWRYLVGAAAAALLIVAGMMLQAVRSPTALPLAAMPAAAASTSIDAQNVTGGVAVPEALAQTREQKRFDRYDKDRNGSITREEYLSSRRKAFAKLDRDGNGVLSFDEWAAKAEAKFGTADKDRSGALNAAEFATTAMKRKAPAKRNCVPGGQSKGAPDDGKDEDS